MTYAAYLVTVENSTLGYRRILHYETQKSDLRKNQWQIHFTLTPEKKRL